MTASLTHPRTIDVHAHAVLADLVEPNGWEEWERYGPWLTDDNEFRVCDYRLHGVPYRGSAFMDPALRLAAMDRARIDLQVLSPNPLTYFHHIDARDAARFCKRHNDVLADLVGAYPDRLLGFAALPVQDPLTATEELERAVRELGLRGAYFGTQFGNGLAVDSHDLDRLYAKAVQLDVPVFLHPAPAGIDGPPGDARMARFDMELLLGFAHEETLAAATLIFGGVLERHPALDICVSHGGGAVAFIAGRLAAAARNRPWVPGALRADGAFEQALSRLWFDVHVHDRRSLALLEAVVGPERLVLGTNFSGWDQACVDVGSMGAQLSANGARLLRLSP